MHLLYSLFLLRGWLGEKSRLEDSGGIGDDKSPIRKEPGPLCHSLEGSHLGERPDWGHLPPTWRELEINFCYVMSLRFEGFLLLLFPQHSLTDLTITTPILWFSFLCF